MQIDSTEIEDTFAEAFGMRYTRLIVTARDDYWLRAATAEFTGYASSVIGCDMEAGVERWLSPSETPDLRPGAALLAFAFGRDALAKAVANRAGQCIMTAPSAALFNGLRTLDDPNTNTIPLGKHLRFFGDGFQKSKVIADQRFWRIPVMEGEFLCEDQCGVAKGIAGGNFIVQGVDADAALDGARRAVEAIALLPGVMTPFPGGAVRSGSKVGSRYATLRASTADAFCPTLRGRVPSLLHPAANAAIEIVIDGVDVPAVADAMAHGIRAACGSRVVAISAGNYGGKLGPYHFRLHDILAIPQPPRTTTPNLPTP